MQSNIAWPLDCFRSFQNDCKPVFLFWRSVRVRIWISVDDAKIAKEKEPLTLHLLTRKHCLKALRLPVKVNISILIHSLRFFELCSRMYDTISDRNGRMKGKQNTRISFSCTFYYSRGDSINRLSQWDGLTCNYDFNFGYFIEHVTLINGYTEQRHKL